MAAGRGGAGPGWSLGNWGPGRLTGGQRGSPSVRVGPAARRCAGACQVRWRRGAGGELPVLAGACWRREGLLPGCPLHLALARPHPWVLTGLLRDCGSDPSLSGPTAPHAYALLLGSSSTGALLVTCLPSPRGCPAPWAGAGEGPSGFACVAPWWLPGLLGHPRSRLLLPSHSPSSPEGPERSRRWPRARTARQGCTELAGHSGQGPGGGIGACSRGCSGRGAVCLWSPVASAGAMEPRDRLSCPIQAACCQLEWRARQCPSPRTLTSALQPQRESCNVSVLFKESPGLKGFDVRVLGKVLVCPVPPHPRGSRGPLAAVSSYGGFV